MEDTVVAYVSHVKWLNIIVYCTCLWIASSYFFLLLVYFATWVKYGLGTCVHQTTVAVYLSPPNLSNT